MSVKTQPEDRSTSFTRAIGQATGWLGSFPAILIAFAVVGLWAIGGLVVPRGFSNSAYQLVISTSTAVVTFWMVFIIQNTQNREGRAMQTKLDAQSEVLRAMALKMGIEDEDNILERLVGLEDAPEHIIKADQEIVRRASLADNPPTDRAR